MALSSGRNIYWFPIKGYNDTDEEVLRARCDEDERSSPCWSRTLSSRVFKYLDASTILFFGVLMEVLLLRYDCQNHGPLIIHQLNLHRLCPQQSWDIGLNILLPGLSRDKPPSLGDLGAADSQSIHAKQHPQFKDPKELRKGIPWKRRKTKCTLYHATAWLSRQHTT